MRRSADGAPTAGGGRGSRCATPVVRTPGARVLAIDVGAGTADILLAACDEPLENAVKLVVPSRTQVVGAQIRAATAAGVTVVFRGPVMGGGASGSAMKAHLRDGHSFVATEEAALTFADDVDKVRALGVRIVGDGAAAKMLTGGSSDSVREVSSGDIDPAELRDALVLLGVEPRVDAVAVAVQDHGFRPHGSNRVFRFSQWDRAVSERRRVTDLFYAADEVPAELTRLQAAVTLAADLADGGPVLAADTGPAALYGALSRETEDAVIVNVGNGHVICVVALDGRLAGVFEHHTTRLDGAGLEKRLRRFLSGELTGEQVREDGGHGAVLGASAVGRDLPALPFVVTGPRRALLEDSTLPLVYAAPHGDMMLTGCFGLLRALADRGFVPPRPLGAGAR